MPRPRILLVDDNNDFRDTLGLVLLQAGYRVTPARNGEEALQRYRAEPTDVVVTDIIMPDMEGLELIKQMRREFPGVKIIAISGDGRCRPDSYLEFAKRIGAVAALAKPFPSEELLKIITTLVPPANEQPQS